MARTGSAIAVALLICAAPAHAEVEVSPFMLDFELVGRRNTTEASLTVNTLTSPRPVTRKGNTIELLVRESADGGSSLSEKDAQTLLDTLGTATSPLPGGFP